MEKHNRKESVFELVKSMDKAEKRNFKLFATRQGDSQDTKFVRLFDCLASMDSYSEEKILRKCDFVKKEQLPNLKAHLYRQILISLRLLEPRRSELLKLHEQLDFARILFDRGLYQQSENILIKAGETAHLLEQHSLTLQITELHQQVCECRLHGTVSRLSAETNIRIKTICREIQNTTELSDLAVKLYSLHLRLGYARTQKDIDLLERCYKPRLKHFQEPPVRQSFSEKFHWYQAKAWYHYVHHNFAYAYRYGRAWIEMFDENPHMKSILYGNYLHGYSHFLEGSYLTRRYEKFVEHIEKFEAENSHTGVINENAAMISQHVLLTARMNKCIMEGAFKEGLRMTGSAEEYLKRYARRLSLPDRMMLNYKTAVLYFGVGNYAKCMEHLSDIIAVQSPNIRRDLQSYARMLNILATYESGNESDMNNQIESVSAFMVKMKDMTEMKHKLLAFFRQTDGRDILDRKKDFEMLYDRLKPYENHPGERQTFYYFDITSWLKSKITGKSFGEILRERFISTGTQKNLNDTNN